MHFFTIRIPKFVQFDNYLGYLLLCIPLLLGNQSATNEQTPKKSYTIISYASFIPEPYQVEAITLHSLPTLQTMHDLAQLYIGKYAVFFMAIKIQESGAENKASWLATKHNNLVGMRFPKNRETYAIGSTKSNYAIYRNWFEAMLDFKIYMELMEKRHLKKHGKPYANEIEMLNHLFHSYNPYQTWYNDVTFLLQYVNKKYGEKTKKIDNIIVLD